MSSLADLPRPPIMEQAIPVSNVAGEAYGAYSAEQTGTALRQFARVPAPFGGSGLAGFTTPWKDTLNLTEAYSSLLPIQGARGEAALRKQIEQLDARTQAQLVAISNKVDLLAGAFQSFLGRPGSRAELAPPPLTSKGGVTNHEEDALADLFDQIADGAAAPSWALEASRQSLEHEEPSVRAAAGRALAHLAPKEALSLLPTAIAKESNSFTASIMRGALRAAEA